VLQNFVEFALNTMKVTMRDLAAAHRANQRDHLANMCDQWRNRRGPQAVRWWAWFGFDWWFRLDLASRPKERDCCTVCISICFAAFALGLNAAVAMAVDVLVIWPHPTGLQKGCIRPADTL